MLFAAIGVTLLFVVSIASCAVMLQDLGDIELDLFKDGCRESDEPIIAAAARGSTRGVERELQAGVDPNLSADDETALTCAAAKGRPAVVTLLLERGAEPTVEALQTAMRARTVALGLPDTEAPAVDPVRDEIVRLMLDHGADPNGGEDGPSPLLFAAWRGQLSVVDLLLTHSAEPNYGGRVPSFMITFAQGGLGATSTTAQLAPLPKPRGEYVDNVPPLIGAAWSGHLDIATRLLDAGADPNLASDEAFTAIYAAAARGDRPMLELLLARGASPTPTVRAGVLSPADVARAAGHPDIADLLVAAAPVG